MNACSALTAAASAVFYASWAMRDAYSAAATAAEASSSAMAAVSTASNFY